MSTITREFTKEQLIEQARTNLTCHRTAINHSLAQVDAVLFEIALASLEAEAVVITDDMAYAFHHALSDSSLGADEVEEIKTGLRAALANVTARQRRYLCMMKMAFFHVHSVVANQKKMRAVVASTMVTSTVTTQSTA